MEQKRESQNWQPQEQAQPTMPLEIRIHAPEVPPPAREPAYEKGMKKTDVGFKDANPEDLNMDIGGEYEN